MKLTFWLRFSVFNLFIVALLGVMMRYKIAFSLPWVDQKHVQESHSHFAFYGWLTMCIYVLIMRYLQRVLSHVSVKKYEKLVVVNLFAAFGMLVSFIYGGYFWLSIVFSTLALLIGFVFFFLLLNDMKGVKEHSKIWFLSALFFAVLSSIGVFYLAYMMVNGNINQDFYLASTYYYLHFQYNGFFIFSCIGFLLFSLREAGVQISEKQNNTLFWAMFLGCMIGYGLSVLWMDLPLWVFAVIVLGTLSQTFGALKLYLLVKGCWEKLVLHWSPMQRFVLIFAGFAFAVKILLQLGSNIPAVNQFAFGFRNIVIAYLHLVLLMCISTFLVSQILATNYFQISKNLLIGLKLFLLGVFLNEAVLGIMGIFSIKYILVPHSAYALLVCSVLMMAAVLWMLLNMRSKTTA